MCCLCRITLVQHTLTIKRRTTWLHNANNYTIIIDKNNYMYYLCYYYISAYKFGLLYVNDFINNDVLIVSNNDNNKITCNGS